jgi:DNA-binding transcriptional ArsR family regulator
MDPLRPDPERDVTLDQATLRVLAHPMRLTLLNHLRQHGPATGRQLAKVYGIDSGAASYHLRRLAAGGLIEEDQDRGTGRDRWWRALHRTSFHDPATADPADREASRAYGQAVVLAYGDRLRTLAGQIPLLAEDWYGAAIFSDYTLKLTPTALNSLKSELVAVINRYRDEPVGETSVSVQLQAYPLVETPNVAAD